MKTLFSIIVSLLIAASSIALAMNVQQQDPLCTAEEHEGFIVENNGTPPEGATPQNLPHNMESAGIYQEDFRCEESNDRCLWVYNEAKAEWVECKGDYVDLRQ